MSPLSLVSLFVVRDCTMQYITHDVLPLAIVLLHFEVDLGHEEKAGGGIHALGINSNAGAALPSRSPRKIGANPRNA